jgi:hypothetical protein
MFARFRNDKTEINVNVTLVRDFVPHEENETKINFLGGDSVTVPFSNRAVRHAFSKALEPVTEGE